MYDHGKKLIVLLKENFYFENLFLFRLWFLKKDNSLLMNFKFSALISAILELIISD